MLFAALRSLTQNRDTRWILRRIARSPHKLAKLRNLARVQWAKLRRDPAGGGGLPLIVSVEPTNACNMKCPMCPTGLGAVRRPTGLMAMADYARLLDQLERSVFVMTFWGWGESTLHPRLFDMIEMASRRGIFTMLTMNGTSFDAERLVGSGLDYLVVSFDGTREESYGPVRRGGDLRRAIDGVRALAAEKRRRGTDRPKLNMGFIVTRLNEAELTGLDDVAREIGFDATRPKYLHTITRQVAEELRPTDPALVGTLGRSGPGRLLERDVPGIVRPPARPGCGILWQYAMVFWDGTMVPCCYDWDADRPLGNAFRDGIDAAWHGPAYAEMRRRVFSAKASIPLCRECDGGDITVFFSDTFLLNR